MDNPVQFMNQEESKRFISCKTPRQKFNLFMEGTSLSIIEKNYRLAGRIIAEDEENIAEVAKDLESLKLAEKEASRKVSGLAKVNEDIEKVKSRIKELVWCKIKKCENKLVEKKSEMERVERLVVHHTGAKEVAITKVKEGEAQTEMLKADVVLLSEKQRLMVGKVRSMRVSERDALSAIERAEVGIL